MKIVGRFALALLVACCLPACASTSMDVAGVSAPAEPAVYTGRGPFTPMAPDRPAIPVDLVADAGGGPIHLSLPLRAAGIRPGDVVADVGCGTGRHVLEFAEAAGPDGFVYCRDPNERSIETLREKAAGAGAARLDIAVSDRGDVGLPANRIDVALLVDVYRYVLLQESTKAAFVDSLYRAMRPGGVVVIVHVKSSHLQDAALLREVRAQTIADFVARGFTAGRRVEIRDPMWPREVLEFQRPVIGR
jgi:predicted methyltransferase